MQTKPLFSCAALVLPLVCSSCIIKIGGGDGGGRSTVTSITSRSDSPRESARRNRESLGHLSPGMTRDEVDELMGRTTRAQARASGIANPHRWESFPLDDGIRAEVFFYYTDQQKADGLVTEDELTPVWFEDSQLVGWGRGGYESWRRKAAGE